MNGQDAKDSSAGERNEGRDEEGNDDSEKNEGGDEEENDDGLLMKIVAQRAGGAPVQELTALAAVPSSEDLATQDMVLLKTSKFKGSNPFVDRRCEPKNNTLPAGEEAVENDRVGGEESNPHSLLGIAVGIRQELVPGAYAESGTQSIVGGIQPERNGSIGSPGQTPPFEIELARAWPVSLPVAVADEEPVIWGNKKCWGGQSWISTKKGILLAWVSLLLLVTTVLTPIIAQKLQAMGGNQDVIRQQHIKKTIERVFGENYFDNEQKEKALHWIVYDDPLKDLAVKEDSGKDDLNYLIQRFSLVAIYYQTNARQPWNYCNPPVGKQSNWCYYTFYEKLRLIKENPSEEMSARWLSATHECQWMGIYCEEGSKHVSEFQMRSNSFHGTIPAELSKLTYIKTLDLGSNFLSGSLPSWIGHLTLLESLKLPANQLSGWFIPWRNYMVEVGGKPLDRLNPRRNLLPFHPPIAYSGQQSDNRPLIQKIRGACHIDLFVP